MIAESFELANNVVFEAHYSDLSIYELYPDDTPKQLADMIQSLDRYDSVLFDAKVCIRIHGKDFGVQWLGGNHYNDYESFLNDSYFAEMVEQAQIEAKQEIAEYITILQQTIV
jgi:hypothetical protein